MMDPMLLAILRGRQVNQREQDPSEISRFKGGSATFDEAAFAKDKIKDMKRPGVFQDKVARLPVQDAMLRTPTPNSPTRVGGMAQVPGMGNSKRPVWQDWNTLPGQITPIGQEVAPGQLKDLVGEAFGAAPQPQRPTRQRMPSVGFIGRNFLGRPPEGLMMEEGAQRPSMIPKLGQKKIKY